MRACIKGDAGHFLQCGKLVIDGRSQGVHAMKRIILSGKCGVSSGDLPRNGRRRTRAARSALFAAGLLGVAAQRVHAQNAATWIGPNNSFWNIAANWDVGVVPNSGTTSVFIDGRNTAVSNVRLNIS